MSRLKEKTNIIFVPFLIIFISYIAVYTVLNWALFIDRHVLPLKDDVTDVLMPLFLIWVPLLIWLRPRVMILPKKGGARKGDARTGILFAAWLVIAAPVLILQAYMETATGKLTKVSNVEELATAPVTKYYTLTKDYYVDKDNASGFYSSKVSGKHNEDLTYEIHFVMPVCNDSTDTVGSPAAWIGVLYRKGLSNNISENEKEEKWKTFVEESEKDFDTKNVHDFTYLQRAGYDDDHDHYVKALHKNRKFTTGNDRILLEVNEPFEARNGNKLTWVFATFAGGALLFFLILLFIKPDEQELQKRLEGHPTKDKDTKEALMYFVPHKDYFITPILVDLNLLIFAIMVCKGLGFVDFPADRLKDWGADFKPLVMQGEWWRLLTSTFLHAGMMHLVSNMAGLLIIGVILEPALGKAKYLACYLISGIVASCASLYFHPLSVGVGASGAIFGMYGAFLALIITGKFPKAISKAFLIFALIFIGFNLLMGMSNGIDNAAHAGGLICGFIIGLLLYTTIKPRSQEEMDALAYEQMTDEAKAEADEKKKEIG